MLGYCGTVHGTTAAIMIMKDARKQLDLITSQPIMMKCFEELNRDNMLGDVQNHWDCFTAVLECGVENLTPKKEE